MARKPTSKASTYRIRSKLSKAQRITKSNNPRYIGNRNDLTRKQKYKLEKMNLKNERAAMNAKQDTIRAIGSAFAQNLAPGTASAGFAVANNMSKHETPVNNLISGGSNQAGTSNDEEIEDVMPGGSVLR